MGQGDAARHSHDVFMEGAKVIKKAVNETWKRAPKAPMFTRKPNPKAKVRYHPKTGKPMKIIYTKRLITGHGYQIAASGAAVAAMGVYSKEAATLRLEMEKESANTPFLPRYSTGAKALLEQFLCAYSQEAFFNAYCMKEALQTHKRVTAKMMDIGFRRAHKSVFAAAAPPCLNVCVAPYVRPPKVDKDGNKKKADAEEEEDEANPGEEDANASEDEGPEQDEQE